MKIQTIFLICLSCALASCELFDAAGNSDRGSSPEAPSRTPTNPPSGDLRYATAEDMPFALNSQILRELGSRVYKYEQERFFWQSEDVPPTLHPIPNKIIDMAQETIRPTNPINCGVDLDGEVTTGRRLADCAEKNANNPNAYAWSGAVKGLNGEGEWRLIAHKDGKSVWKDISTGLLWSPTIRSANWDAASGNVDQSEQICNGANDLDQERFLGIGADEAAWRLPTRNDFLLADINGSRFVLSTLPNGDLQEYWTANYIPSEEAAWAIQLGTGILAKKAENLQLPVRCVGHVIK